MMTAKSNSLGSFPNDWTDPLRTLAAALLAAFKPAAGYEVHPRRLPLLDAACRALAGTRGAVRSALLAVRARARLAKLYAARPRFRSAALRRHLERNILPGLALYQTLREEGWEYDAGGDEAEALAEVDRIFAVWVEGSGHYRLARFMGRRRLRLPFALLRLLNRMILKAGYPSAGWKRRWQEDSPRCIAYDFIDCFYLNMLAAYGAPELTASFCRCDDLLYAALPGVSWERTRTLGRGGDRCDFRFYRREGGRT